MFAGEEALVAVEGVEVSVHHLGVVPHSDLKDGDTSLAEMEALSHGSEMDEWIYRIRYKEKGEGETVVCILRN